MSKVKRYIPQTLFLLAAGLLVGCTGADDNNSGVGGDRDAILINADVRKMPEGSRATTYNNATELQTEAHFSIAAYNENTTTEYISPTTVDWDDSESKWEFNSGASHYYWPLPPSNVGDWPKLDFFAYMPKEASKPSYITSGPTYSVVSSNPQATFTCADMPMTYDVATPGTGQGYLMKEFVWAITKGQDKPNQGASGVTMKFRHPFARIRFQLSASHPNIQINSITFKNLKTGGTCVLNNTGIEDTYYYKTSVWSSLTPAEGGSNLVMTLSEKDGSGNYIATNTNTFNDNPASAVPIGGYASSAHQYLDLIVVPQEWAGEIEVDASWNDWGDTPVPHTVRTTIPAITWRAGYSYTYTFTISTDDLTVDITNFTEQW